MADETEIADELVLDHELLESLALRLAGVKDVKAEAEKTEKRLKKEMKDILAELPKAKKYLTPTMVVTVTKNRGQPRLSTDKLLDQGVDPGVIDAATSRTPFESVGVKVREDKGD